MTQSLNKDSTGNVFLRKNLSSLYLVFDTQLFRSFLNIYIEKIFYFLHSIEKNVKITERILLQYFSYGKTFL